MKNIYYKFYSVLFLCLGFSYSYTQEAPVAAGGEGTGSGGTVSYSVGQVVYTSNSGVANNTIEGVQQPYEIQTVGTAENSFNINLSVFPNPTHNFLTIDMGGHLFSNPKYKLMDSQGKIILSGKIVGNQYQLIVQELPPASYFLHVLEENMPIRSFKIIVN